LEELKKLLPPHKVVVCKNISWKGKKFILQFNRAHTGSGTLLIESEKQLEELQKKFPERPVRVVKYIEGPMFTNNNVVWGKKILCGNINYQITGLKPFTERPFATIGNDWALPHKLLSKKQLKEYETIAKKVGQKLQKSGWKGLFGIDVILDEKTKKLYLIEINARQPASTTYESQLQKKVSSMKYGVSSFEAHLASLLELDPDHLKLIEIESGAQIIQKVTTNYSLLKPKLKKITEQLKKDGFKTVNYNNTELETDLLRIQSTKGIMKAHNKFNENGEKIIESLTL
jgi:carbamoylphosphate synthase large subunit